MCVCINETACCMGIENRGKGMITALSKDTGFEMQKGVSSVGVFWITYTNIFTSICNSK